MKLNIANNPGMKITLIGAGANLFLVIIKFIGGTLGRSTALLADAFHSLSDLLNDGIVLFTHHIGRMPKDENHPYGHGKAETIGATLIGVAILIVSFHIAEDVLEVILSDQRITPNWATTLVALASIACKETLFRYTRKIGKQVGSPALIANAFDHRSDALSSFATLIGILGALAGFPIFDPLAGGVVALMIARTGLEVLKHALSELMETSLDRDTLDTIESIILETPGVIHAHEIRTRKIGGKVMIDLHIMVSPKISVTEGHNIGEHVRHRLKEAVDKVEDILVHVDPEDDRYKERLYPTRRKELEQLIRPIIEQTPGIRNHPHQIRIHYFKEEVQVEIIVHLEPGQSLEHTPSIIAELKNKISELDPIHEVKVLLNLE